MAARRPGDGGERAGAHHGRDVEERRELLVGPLGAVVGLDRQQPAVRRRARRRGERRRRAPARCRRRGTAGGSPWPPRPRRGRRTACRPIPRGGVAESTRAPWARATAAVASVEPSSTTMTSCGRGSSSAQRGEQHGQRALLVAGRDHDRHRRGPAARHRGPTGRAVVASAGRGVGMRASSSAPATRPSDDEQDIGHDQARLGSDARAARSDLGACRHACPAGEHVVVRPPRSGPGSPSTAPMRSARTGTTQAAGAGCPARPTA